MLTTNLRDCGFGFKEAEVRSERVKTGRFLSPNGSLLSMVRWRGQETARETGTC